MLSTLCARSFSAAAPKLGNSLPAHIRDAGSLCAFKILVQVQQPVVLLNKNNYHSMQMFLPFHWPRAHHVTCK